jgi:hypothetical protein
MSTLRVRFRDHEGFHRSTLHMAIAGALGGLFALILQHAIAGFGVFHGAWSLATLIVPTAYAAAAPDRRLRFTNLALLLALGLVGGTAFTALTGAGQMHAGLAVMALCFGASLGYGATRSRVAVLFAGALVFLLMREVLIVTMQLYPMLPAWAVAGIGGTAFSFIGVIALLPRHVELKRDRVTAVYEKTAPVLEGEIRTLAEQAREVWVKVDAEVEADSPVRPAVEDSVLRLFDVGRRWASVEKQGARGTTAGELAARMEILTDKMGRTEDTIARDQYGQAHAALAEQLRYLKEIGTARERVIARMHHYLAAMEKLRFAVINHRSHDASQMSTEVQPMLNDLAHLGKEIDYASQALGEIETETPVAKA